MLGQGVFAQNKNGYITNRKPLVSAPYVALPLGDIKPKGMLLEMLERQKTGLSSRLDEFDFIGFPGAQNSGWLGEGTHASGLVTYWLDGLVPLAYLLNDEDLIADATKWIDWNLENQRADGNFDVYKEEQISGTAWTMLKAMQQYYMATDDERVIEFMTRYFDFMLKVLPEKPIDYAYRNNVPKNETEKEITPFWWSVKRAGDVEAMVYWLYNITGDKSLLELGKLIYEQTYNWTDTFNEGKFVQLNPAPFYHCVNIGQGLKQPIVHYQQSKESRHLNAPKNGLRDLRNIYGFVNGMFGADEHLHSNNPTQGSEFCTAVEMMFSFESMLSITGDVYYADYLEKLAYNVLPTQHTDDFDGRQYFQQVNQVLINGEDRNFINDGCGHVLYGEMTGFPCCTGNMHQGWPKFIQNLWYATVDGGVAALVYGESEVDIKVANGKRVTIIEDTDYPFREDIKFTVKSEGSVDFPFHLRIPEWCEGATVKVNGELVDDFVVESNIAKLKREWSDGDVVELHLPMEIRHSRWFHRSLGIERGPLVYALKIGEDWRKTTRSTYTTKYWNPETPFWEVYPTTPWNYTFSEKFIANPEYEVVYTDEVAEYPWNQAGAPIIIKTQAHEIPQWVLENNSAGLIPSRSLPPSKKIKREKTNIELIPYGCTALRVAQFPVAM